MKIDAMDISPFLKVVFSTFTIMFAGPLFAQETKALVSRCAGVTDPDYVNVKIYQVGEKKVALIQQQFGDGDGYAEDLIEVKFNGLESDSSSVFLQVKDSYPDLPKISETPSKKTKEAMIIVPNFGEGSGKLDASKGPAGFEVSEEQDCETIREIQSGF